MEKKKFKKSWSKHSRVKCDCRHYPKDHYRREGCCCLECGCTWYHPNYKYQKRKQNEQFTISKNRFKELLPTLLEEHYGKYLAVVGNNPYEIDEDKDKLFGRVTEKYGNVTMYIGKIIPENEREVAVMPSSFAR